MENLFDLDFIKWNDILLTIIPALINTGIFLYVAFFMPQKRTNNSFSVFVLLLGLWQIAEGLARMSNTVEGAYEWMKISEVLMLMFLPFGILFILHFSEWHTKIPNNRTFPLLFLPTIASLFIVIARLDKFAMVKSEYWHWVANPQPNLINFFLYGWISVGGLLMLTFLWVFHAKVRKGDPKRKQSLLFALGFTLPVIGGIIMEVFFPLVFGLNDVPVTASFVTVFSITALVAINKYKFLDFSPKHQWDQIVESMNEGILIVNNEGEIMYANEMFCHLTGYGYEELLGKIAGKLFSDSLDQINEIGQIREVRAHKRAGQHEIQIKTKSGEKIWMIVNTSPYLDSKGKQIGAIGIHTDINQRKKAEEKLIENEFFLKESQKKANIGTYKTNFVIGSWQSSETLDIIFGIDKNYNRSTAGWLAIVHPDDKEEVNEYLLLEVIGKQKSFNKVYRIISINHKQTKWVHGLGDVKFDAKGNITEMIGTIQDITEHRRLEEETLEKERLFSFLYNNTPVMMHSINKEGELLSVSDYWIEKLGYTRQEVIGKNFTDFLTEESRKQAIENNLPRFIHTGHLENADYSFVKKNGEVIDCLLSAVSHQDTNKNFVRSLAVITDITDRKKAEYELTKSQQTYKSLFDKNPDGVYSFDLTGNFTSFNQAVLERMGYTAEELYTMNFAPFIVPEDTERVIGHFMKAATGEPQSYETCLVSAKGEKIFVNITNMPIVVDGNIIGVYGIAKDLTIPKMAEEMVRKSETNYKDLINNISDIVCTHEIEGKILSINPTAEKLLGYDAAKILKMNIQDILAPEIKYQYPHYIVALKKNGFSEGLMKVHTSAGKTRIWEFSNSIRTNADGTLIVQSLAKDVTERKKAEKELSKIFSLSPDLIAVSHPNGQFKKINPAWEKVLGYSVDEIMKMRFDELIHPIDIAQTNKAVQKDANPNTTIKFINRYKCKDDSFKFLEWNATSSSNGTLYAIARDITERKQAERFKSLENEILTILNNTTNLKTTINTVLLVIRKEMGFSAVGLRLNQDDDFPYFSQHGFQNDFILTENSLTAKDRDGNICRDENGKPLLECACGLVISGKGDKTNPLFTKSGSFWTNNTYSLLELPPEKDPRFHPRNKCMHFGFGSMAIIPIRGDGKIAGTLQLNQKEQNAFTNDMINFFETICLNIGTAIMRKLAKEALIKSEEDYRNLFETHSAIKLIIDPDNGNIYNANIPAAEFYGKSRKELRGMNIGQLNFGNSPDEIKNNLERSKHLQTIHFEFKHKCANDKIKDVEIFGNAITMSKKKYIHAIIIDITERKLAEESLRRSETNLNAIFENTSTGFLLLEPDLNIVAFNNRCNEITKITFNKELKKGSNYTTVIPPFRQKAFIGLHKRVLQGEMINYETSYEINDVSVIYYEVNSKPVKNDMGSIIGISFAINDITERKKSYNNLIKAESQIRNFATHLNRVLETERSNLAREIHDELGQQLSGIKITLASFKKIHEKDFVNEKIVSDLMKDVDSTMQSLRKISTQLRPGILDTLGLIPSIRWLAEEFEKHSKVECQLNLNVKEEKFEKDISTCYFRICQESLTNISKHAKASKVTIDVKHKKDELILIITDNGIGMADKKLNNPFSMGLLGMRERANIIGGEFIIKSAPNEGTVTQLKAKVPPTIKRTKANDKFAMR